jgi:hypothetical protein
VERSGARLQDRRAQVAEEVLRHAPWEPVAQAVGERGAVDRHSNRPTQPAEEVRRCSGSAELAPIDRVLDRQDQHLADHPEAEAKHQHVQRGRELCGVRIHGRERNQPDRHQREPKDREEFIAAGTGDDAARADRGDQDAQHHRQQE